MRRVLEEYSGEAQSKAFGAFWDRIAEQTKAALKKDSKHTVVSLSPEQQKKWQEAITPVVAEWVKSTPHGRKVLGAYRGILQKIKAGS